MKYIVTGGAGFIGSHLVSKLLELGHEVIVIDNFYSGSEKNLKQHQNNKSLSIIKRDICENLEDIFSKNKIDALFHLAAIVSVPYSIEHPLEADKTNVSGTFNLLECCRKFGVKRFIFSSSCAIYGNQEKLPMIETMKPNPMSPYALGKLIGEHYCKLFSFLYSLECICLRYFNVYGPRQNPNGNYASLIPKFIDFVKNNQVPKINGLGEQTRDFVFVSDVVEANISALETNNKECFGEIFNIGTARSISVNEVASQIIKLSGKHIIPVHGPAIIELHDALADIIKARNLLGWSPKFQFEKGLKETYDYFSLV